MVPFIKIDKGLEAEENGVQLMKPMPDLDRLLSRARGLGVFGTKERSVINLANREGIAAIVGSNSRSPGRCSPPASSRSSSPRSTSRAPSGQRRTGSFSTSSSKALDTLPGDDRVMLKLSLPVEPGLFDPLVDHPRVLRVVALSGRLCAPRSLRRARQEPRRHRQLLAAPCSRTCATA